VSVGTREKEQEDRELRGDRAKCPERRDMLLRTEGGWEAYCK
jgi:hypothetical protein